ncbi:MULTISPECIES: transposase [unclassified Microcoleus]|uniref:transposase n=1 Tax=unclassified Microcoleus TaxID=2642155 RepID=UPI004040A3F7
MKYCPLKSCPRPLNWTKTEILDGIFYQLKNGCNWEDVTFRLTPYSTVYWFYLQWREQGALEELMRVLHCQVREQVKKPQVDYVDDYRLTLQCKIPVMPVLHHS